MSKWCLNLHHAVLERVSSDSDGDEDGDKNRGMRDQNVITGDFLKV